MGMMDVSTPAPGVEEMLQFLYLMPVAIVRLGMTGAVEMLNPKAVHLLHDLDIDAGYADGATILEALHPGLAQQWQATAGQVGPVMTSLRCSPARPHGSELHLQIQVVRPNQHCTMLAIEDVTATVEQERELARQRRRMGLVLEHIRGYGAALLDLAGRVTEWNPSIGRLLDIKADELVGHPLMSWVSDYPVRAERTPDFPAIQAIVSRYGRCELEAPWRRTDGQLLWGDCVVVPVLEAGGQTSGYVAVIRDVTDEHKRTQLLLDEALTDPLTHLYNRRGLEKRLAVAPRRPAALESRSAVAPATISGIMADIDHFKRVNDAYGHDGGDLVLKAVAVALQAAARDGDTVARIGGEEFVLVLPGVSADEAGRVAERLRATIERLVIEAGGSQVRVTASFGVAEQCAQEAWSVTLERADAALYRAKDEGRNRVVQAQPGQPPAVAAERAAKA
jgi:diguanylate cyclase (GGDEF)-like protein/PAS domain S-box-containing protein